MDKREKIRGQNLKGKAQKFLVGAFLGIIVLVLSVPGAAALSAATAGGGTAHILSADITPQAGYGELSNGSYNQLSIAIANTNLSDSSIVSSTYTSYGVNNTTTTNYYASSLIFSNVTLSELNSHSANKIVLDIQANSAATVILGFGNYNGSSFVFNPLENASLSAPGVNSTYNSTTNTTTNTTVYSSVSFALSPALIVGNGTLAYEIEWTNATAVPTYTVLGYAVGNTAGGPWYQVGMSTGYIGAFFVVVLFGSIVLPYHNVGAKQVVYIVKRGNTRKLKKNKDTRRRK